MMRTPGPPIRVLSVLAAGSAAVYFWSTALTGRTASELLRGGRDATLSAAPALEPAAPRLHAFRRPLRRRSATPRPSRPAAAPVVEPAPQALADAVVYVGSTGALPVQLGNPFRGLIGTPSAPVQPVRTPDHGAFDDRSVDDAGRAGRASRRRRARLDRREHAGRRRAVRAASLGRDAGRPPKPRPSAAAGRRTPLRRRLRRRRRRRAPRR